MRIAHEECVQCACVQKNGAYKWRELPEFKAVFVDVLHASMVSKLKTKEVQAQGHFVQAPKTYFNALQNIYIVPYFKTITKQFLCVCSGVCIDVVTHALRTGQNKM